MFIQYRYIHSRTSMRWSAKMSKTSGTLFYDKIIVCLSEALRYSAVTAWAGISKWHDLCGFQ